MANPIAACPARASGAQGARHDHPVRFPRVSAAVAPVRRVSRRTLAAYGIGAAAYGVKDAGFGSFLLIFYNQVIGLPPGTVGLVVMAALLLDAAIDPAIGFLSDRTRSRWGRRHPWMYAAALPIGLGWLLLWNPPAMGQGATLAWLFAAAVIVRTAVSAYEVPSQALTPELTADYDERTRITAWRYLFGWLGGMAMLVSAYGVFLRPEGAQANGLLNRDGYVGFGIAGAVAMTLAILVSAIGTHREIPTLPHPPIERVPWREGVTQTVESARNRGFVVLLLAALCLYTNQGVGFALTTYLYNYVWHFGTAEFLMLPAVLFAGVIGAFVAAPWLARRIGKPRAAQRFVIAAAVLMAMPYSLRLAGWFPDPGTPWMLSALFGISAVNTACSVSVAMIGQSMMADVVEDSEARTGRRAEGLFYSGAFLVQKCTGGIGIAVAGALLWAVGFPDTAVQGQVAAGVLDRLTMAYVALYLTLATAAIVLLGRFPFGRAEHLARVKALAAG